VEFARGISASQHNLRSQTDTAPFSEQHIVIHMLTGARCLLSGEVGGETPSYLFRSPKNSEGAYP
jgi:hypothetical protein